MFAFRATEVSAVVSGGVEGLTPRELGGLLTGLDHGQRALEADYAKVIDHTARTMAFQADGHRSVVAWCRAQTGWSTPTAQNHIRISRLLAARPIIATALADGQIGVDQVATLAKAFANPRCGTKLDDTLLNIFVALAPKVSHRQFALAVTHWERLADSDGAHRDATRIDQDRRASLIQHADGRFSLTVEGGALDGELLREVLDRYIDAEFRTDWAACVAEHGDRACNDLMARTAPQRRFDAVLRIFSDAASTPPGSKQPQTVVNLLVDLDTLTDYLANNLPTTDTRHPTTDTDTDDTDDTDDDDTDDEVNDDEVNDDEDEDDEVNDDEDEDDEDDEDEVDEDEVDEDEVEVDEEEVEVEVEVEANDDEVDDVEDEVDETKDETKDEVEVDDDTGDDDTVDDDTGGVSDPGQQPGPWPPVTPPSRPAGRGGEPWRRCQTLNGVPVPIADVVAALWYGQIRKIIVDRNGTILHYGRRKRLFTGAAREAVLLANTHCIWPGCDIATTHCDADHINDWQHTGPTDTNNGAPLCPTHNRTKSGGYTVWRDPDGHWHVYRPDRTEI